MPSSARKKRVDLGSGAGRVFGNCSIQCIEPLKSAGAGNQGPDLQSRRGRIEALLPDKAHDPLKVPPHGRGLRKRAGTGSLEHRRRSRGRIGPVGAGTRQLEEPGGPLDIMQPAPHAGIGRHAGPGGSFDRLAQPGDQGLIPATFIQDLLPRIVEPASESRLAALEDAARPGEDRNFARTGIPAMPGQLRKRQGGKGIPARRNRREQQAVICQLGQRVTETTAQATVLAELTSIMDKHQLDRGARIDLPAGKVTKEHRSDTAGAQRTGTLDDIRNNRRKHGRNRRLGKIGQGNPGLGR